MMLKITVIVDDQDDNIIGIKEAIANDLERYGDVKSVKVEEIQPEQMKF